MISPAVRRLNFSVMGHVITGQNFGQVAVRLDPMSHSRNRLTVAVGALPAHAGAMYIPARNRFVFANANVGNSAPDRMAIVHEATHAVLDLHSSRNSAIDDEATAYIAGALYQQFMNEVTWSASSPRVFVAAAAIAQAMYPIRPGTPGGLTLLPYSDSPPAPLLAALRAAIIASPAYVHLNRHREMHYGNDGIPR